MKNLLPVILIFLLVMYVLNARAQTVYRQLQIKDKVFTVEIPNSIEKRALGLGKRKNLPQDCGMLFIFDRRGIYPFWMKNMQFPIDIIWIDGNRVVGTSQNIPAPKNRSLPVYAPPSPVDKVLELNSGTVKVLGIAENDTITIFGE
jgi:uncharacterized protein